MSLSGFGRVRSNLLMCYIYIFIFIFLKFCLLSFLPLTPSATSALLFPTFRFADLIDIHPSLTDFVQTQSTDIEKRDTWWNWPRTEQKWKRSYLGPTIDINTAEMVVWLSGILRKCPGENLVWYLVIIRKEKQNGLNLFSLVIENVMKRFRCCNWGFIYSRMFFFIFFQPNKMLFCVTMMKKS